MMFTPHPYQKYAIERIVNEKHIGLLLDMGLGKTAIVLSAISELIYNTCEVSRVLVIAPKKVSEATWQNEARKWDGMSELRFSTILGTAAQRTNAVNASADVYVINRENVQWLVESLVPEWPFDMVVFDESSSFKSPTSKRFKYMKKVLPTIDRTVILTGTPAPNGLIDLWSQVYLLDRGERLGRNITAYKDRFFDYNPWRFELTPKTGAYECIQKRISDICISMNAADYLQLPEMITDDIAVSLDTKSRKAYDAMKKDMILELKDDEEITALSAAALTNKLLQLCSGVVYDEEHGTHDVHTCKDEAFSELLEQLHGEHCLVFYSYQHELPRLHEICERMKLAVRDLRTPKDMDDWNAGNIDILIAHPASCAYGLNLQQGGHHIVWYTLTWNLELYQQANARLHRQGQRMPTIVHRLLVENSMDEHVAAALVSKNGTQAALMDSLKAEIKGVKR